jgi:hypothetical protein
MSAIERCRTWDFSPRARPVGALRGHVERCEECAHLRISYNSCRNRHCPKCQAAAAKEWLADRQAELLPLPRLSPGQALFPYCLHPARTNRRPLTRLGD